MPRLALMSKIVNVDPYENQPTLHSIQSSHLGMITGSEIRKLKWTRKTTYETGAQLQKQYFLEQLDEFYYEVTSGTLSLTDVQLITSY